jgi:hypothetical protein
MNMPPCRFRIQAGSVAHGVVDATATTIKY